MRPIALLTLLAACRGEVAGVDAGAVSVSADAELVVESDAARETDAAVAAPDSAPEPGEVPLAGFGDITGMCGVLAELELTGAAPAIFRGAIDFADDRYDDPADRDQLTAGGVEMILDGNAGGSSVYSEVFAFELLARCELAGLVKTETEIVYDVTDTKRTDLLVEIDGHKIGVSVTRAVTYPFGSPYTMSAATTLLDRKLDDIQISSANVSDADAWDKQILAVLAYDDQHADVAAAAWAALDDATRADTIVIITVTAGDDLFVYTDS